LGYGRIRLGKTKRIFITDYQRGVWYRDGAFAGILGPCSRSFSLGNQIVLVDMRPVHFIIESIPYNDALHNPAVISIGAELKVSDPHVASNTLKNQVNDSVAIVRDAIRIFLSKMIVDSAMDLRATIARDIEAAANMDLNKVGMQISDLEITEAWSRAVGPPATAGAN